MREISCGDGCLDDRSLGRAGHFVRRTHSMGSSRLHDRQFAPVEVALLNVKLRRPLNTIRELRLKISRFARWSSLRHVSDRGTQDTFREREKALPGTRRVEHLQSPDQDIVFTDVDVV